MTGGAWQWSTSKNARLNTISALDRNSSDIRDPGGQYGDEDFLIVGLDSRLGRQRQHGRRHHRRRRRRTLGHVMLVNIPANRKRVVAVSFPRDLAITPMQCEAWNPETGKYGPLYDAKTKTYGPKMIYTETKLNSAFAFGGPKCLVKEIQKLSGLSINRLHRRRLLRLREDGRRPRRRRGVLQHRAARLRAGHGPRPRRTSGPRRLHRLELRAGPPGHHRDQRRLRPDQTPAAVLVVTAAVVDLRRHPAGPQQAQQRGQHVHQRHRRRQRQVQGPGPTRSVVAGHGGRARHVRHRARPG